MIAMQMILTFNRNPMPELRERFNPDCKYHFTRCGDGCVVDDVGISVCHHDVTFSFFCRMENNVCLIMCQIKNTGGLLDVLAASC